MLETATGITAGCICYPEEAPVPAGLVEPRHGARPLLGAGGEAGEVDHRNLRLSRHRATRIIQGKLPNEKLAPCSSVSTCVFAAA